MVGRRFALVAACAPLLGCAAENAPRSREPTAAEVRTPLPRAVAAEPGGITLPYETATADDMACAKEAALAFAECIGAMFERGRYRAMVRACDAAAKEPRPEEERAHVTSACVAMLPPALWVANARPEAVSVMSAACEKTNATERIARAARAAVITMRGIERGPLDYDDKRHSMRDAVVAFAAACEVDAKKTAALAVAIEHGRVATLK